MKRRYLYVALGLLISVNVVVLVGVAHNRRGAPEAVLTLSERELPLAWNFRSKENTGVSLRLNVNHDADHWEWFDEDKLAELGFDTEPYMEVEDKHIRRALPKKAYVVLEYDGVAWQQYRQRQREKIESLALQVAQGKLKAEAAERQKKEKLFQLTVASRLFAIDAGLDPRALRERYSDRGRYIIVAAQVRMQVDWRPKTKDNRRRRHLSGRVQQILVEQLHVPRPLYSDLQDLAEGSRIRPGYTYYNPKSPARVRYQVQVAFGQRLEPWILAIDKVAGDEVEPSNNNGVI
ncbi:hypothetical protein Pcar_1340 [Syntrophotalea carbinolica DSM 2380]|uniref:DUF4824 family protein n=1 Tax=Syntrophotalea carbinolica (strain DSM 2380 / NBRC 103641 / GraBd1) TaxID=338963 RepID=Q3A4W8_SYNC1|nr:DUF4824 family protein [Syntrophotalea carbinolica]ABA88589.1 hypothetical protein Pcar_1340 [Syntrophotalea carbinolica DSM 2380]